METQTAPPLAAQVAARCLAEGRLRPGLRVLVAVSAGADSTALAALLAEAGEHGLPLDLVLAHVDHGWRGAAEAAADRRLLEALAAHLDLPLRTSQPAPGDVARTEDGARKWRYRWLAEAARAEGCTHVATGHHVGDQAETFLMRLLRGSGLVGLAAIPPVRPLGRHGLTVVRPLLEVEPQDLRRYLAARGLAWREDPTNADLSRDRAAVRARLAALPARGHALAAIAARLRRRLEAREAALQARMRGGFRHHPLAAAVEMPREMLRPLRGEFLALALRHAGRLLRAERDGPWFSRRHVERFERLLTEGGDLDLPRGLRLHVAGGRAWLARREPPPPRLPEILREDLPRAAFDVEAWRRENRRGVVALDAGVLGDTPRARLMQKEDRFWPHGRGEAREVVIGAWLARRGMPALARRGQVVVEGASGVAWVVGHRVDRRHLVGPRTQTVAVLSLRWPADDAPATP